MQSSDAFLSFRHDASRWLALLLAKTLEDAGIDVFIDIRLRGGRFDTELLEQIEQRPYFIVVLEPGTLPRCREPEDWVLRELRHAVETDRTIIPVATAEFESGDIDEFLPADMARELRRFHGITVRYKTFQLQVTELASEYLVPIEVTLGIDEQISDAARDRAAVARDAAASAAADLAALGLEDLAFGRQARSVLVQLVGVPAFALTELTARVLNFGRRPKSLPPDVVDLLGPYLPSLDIGSVKTVSPARLPVAQRRFSIMSVGGRVYLEHAPQIDDVRAMTALLHELVHVEQYRRLGRLRFARMYAAGFAAGMSYRENPLEAEAFAIARLHRDELAAAVG